MHLERRPARQSDDGREPGRGDAAVLSLLEGGGEAGGGGAASGGGGAEEDGGHRGPAPGAAGRCARERPTGWTAPDPPRRIEARPGGAEDRGGAAHAAGEPDARHRVAGVPGAPREGQGGTGPRAAGSDGRAGAHGGAGVARGPAGEAKGFRAGEGEAGGAEARPGTVPVAARLGWSLRLRGAGGDRPRRPERTRRPVDGGQLPGPLQAPQPRGGASGLRGRSDGLLHTP
jgi:hypothetical protein